MIRLMLAATNRYLWKLRFLGHDVQERTPALVEIGTGKAMVLFLRSDDVMGTLDLMGGFQVPYYQSFEDSVECIIIVLLHLLLLRQ